MLISARPDKINNRDIFGHLEGDLMMFNHPTKTNLITLRERKSRFMIAIRNPSKKADTTSINMISKLTKIKKHVQSITFDLGSEFARYQWLHDCLDTRIYFYNPGSPYQKGSIENGNGVIRTELPRNCDTKQLVQPNVDKIINNINNRPLKCLSYLTPFEEFQKCINLS